MKKETVFPFLLVILIAGLTYGVLLPYLGFYADDWYVLWGATVNGTRTIVDLHLFDRPLMGYGFAFVYSILGAHPLGWHLYALFLRTAGGLVFLWILRMLFPKNTLETTSAALLMVVYPGLLRQTTAMTFSNQFFAYLSALLSIAFSLCAVLSAPRGQKGLFAGLGLAFSFVYVFYIEYMIGLEGLRFLVLWVAHHPNDPKPFARFKATILRYLPYALPVVVMGVWRLFFFEAGRKGMNVDAVFSSYASPLSVLTIGVELLRDFFETTLIGWFYHAYNLSIGALYRNLIPSFLVAGGAILLYGAFTQWTPPSENADKTPQTLIVVGLLSMLMGLLPVIVVGREVVLDTFTNGYNKYTLHVTASVGMLIIGLLMLLRNRKALIVCVSLLLGFAAFTHYHNAVRFKTQWETQKTIWWQVAWRAPDFADYTVLMSVLPLQPSYIEAHEVWGPANLIYRPDVYDVLVPGEILDDVTKEKLLFGESDQKSVRGLFPMLRDYDKALIFGMPTMQSCVHFYDGNKPELTRNGNTLLQLVAPYSSLVGIQTSESVAQVPEHIFGPEPPHTWCYYYQQATLARQKGDWEAVVALGEEAAEQGYKPLNVVEWLPFFEGYVQVGDLDQAKQLAKIIRSDKLLRYEYCQQLKTPLEIPGFDQDSVSQLLCEK
ncbi:MAG: hypothetical protein HUU38_19120 [Anaerolineales bacterium]|nr:hypothetical protein [Anaerolineales bacterium]